MLTQDGKQDCASLGANLQGTGKDNGPGTQEFSSPENL